MKKLIIFFLFVSTTLFSQVNLKYLNTVDSFQIRELSTQNVIFQFDTSNGIIFPDGSTQKIAAFGSGDSLFHVDSQTWLNSGDSIPKADSVRQVYTADKAILDTIETELITATIDGTERISLNPRSTNTASSIAYFFDTDSNLTTTGSKLASFRNQGLERAYISNAGSFVTFNTLQSGLTTGNTNTILNSSISTVIDFTSRMTLNPNVYSGGVAYLLDTENENTTGSILEIKNEGALKLKVTNDTTFVNNVLKTNEINLNGTSLDSVYSPKYVMENTVTDSLTTQHLKLGGLPHGAAGFEDSTITVSIAASNTWYHATNTTSDTYIALGGVDVAINNDTVQVNHTGVFSGIITITFSANSGNEIEFRVFNITQNRQVAFKQGRTGGGISSFGNISVLIYENNTYGDKYVLQVQNLSAAADVIIRSVQFKFEYLQE